MKLNILLLGFFFISLNTLYSAELEKIHPQVIEITLQELFPNNDATAFFKRAESNTDYENDIDGELDLSANKILEITGKRSFLISIAGIENLVIYIDNQAFQAHVVVTELILHGNALTNLPDILNTFRLSTLSITCNNFTYIPDVIYRLLKTTLTSLNLSNNQIRGLPKNFFKLAPEILERIIYFNIEKNPKINVQGLMDFISGIPRDHLNWLLKEEKIVFDIFENTDL